MVQGYVKLDITVLWVQKQIASTHVLREHSTTKLEAIQELLALHAQLVTTARLMR